jgi:DNA-binding CsgD family transcriptional regulator
MTARLTTRWARWLHQRGLPAEHIAIVLDAPLPAVEAVIEARGRRPPARDIAGNHRARPSERAIRAQTGDKVHRLAELGYPPVAIAYVLAIEPQTVESYLRRTTSSAGGQMRRPRTGGEQLAMDRRRRKRAAKLAARQAVEASRLAWGPRNGCPEDNDLVTPAPLRPPPELQPTAAAGPRQREAGQPAPLHCRWTAPDRPATTGERHGSARLTWSDVDAIRLNHSAGASIYSLARRYHVTPGAIRCVVRGKTWRECDRPMPPAPPALPRAAGMPASHEIPCKQGNVRW